MMCFDLKIYSSFDFALLKRMRYQVFGKSGQMNLNIPSYFVIVSFPNKTPIFSAWNTQMLAFLIPKLVRFSELVEAVR